MSETILEVENLKKHFFLKQGFWNHQTTTIKAVDGVSFKIKKGETLGLVGESGCGKSTLGRTLIRLYEPSSGQILFKGKDFCNIHGLELRRLRRHIQMIFQDPYASLDPRMTVGQILTQPLKIHDLYSPKEQVARAQELLETVGLKAAHIDRYPHEFSGGQRQRISIARAIILEPELIIADEPVSALDVSIQAQILNLLRDLQEKFHLTFLFISHDLKVIEHFCDRVAVMYLGRIVEESTQENLYRQPQHPYTQALFSAIPEVGCGKKKIKRGLDGEVPSPADPPPGCHFHPRCPQRREQCRHQSPPLISLRTNLGDPITLESDQHNDHHSHHEVACWLHHSSQTEASL